MICLYIYLAGVVTMLLMIVFMSWLRMDRTEITVSILLSVFSWISVIIVLSIEYKSWKFKRDIMRNLPKEE